MEDFESQAPIDGAPIDPSTGRPKKFVAVRAEIDAVRAEINAVYERIDAFENQAEEAEASLDAKAKALVKASRKEIEELVANASESVKTEAMRSLEAKSAGLFRRMAEVEGRLALAEDALADDDDGGGASEAAVVAAEPTRAAATRATRQTASTAAQPGPRLAQLIEDQEEDRRTIAKLRRVNLWMEKALEKCVRDNGFDWDAFCGKVDEEMGYGTSSE